MVFNIFSKTSKDSKNVMNSSFYSNKQNWKLKCFLMIMVTFLYDSKTVLLFSKVLYYSTVGQFLG